MWGNTLGWIISIVLLAGMLFGLSAIDSLQKTSPPTDFGKDPKTLAKIALPVSPDTVVRMGDASDAGPVYREAIDDYLANQSEYEPIAASRPTGPSGLKAVELILSATDRSAMTLFADRPDEIVNFEPNRPAMQRWISLPRSCFRSACVRKNRPRQSVTPRLYFRWAQAVSRAADG